jgi:hypothetical protein
MQLVMADQQLLLLLNNFSFASVFTVCSTGRKTSSTAYQGWPNVRLALTSLLRSVQVRCSR